MSRISRQIMNKYQIKDKDICRKCGQIDCICVEEKPVAQMSDFKQDGRLSPEQIQHWRRVLFGMIGPYALIAPCEQIQELRDGFNAQIQRIRT